MIETGKLSSSQMGMLLYPAIAATGILLVPSITAKYADRDLWLSPVWASAIGFLTLYAAFQLNRLYPNLTIIQSGEQILGRIPGKIIGFLYLLFYLHLTGIILREYGEYVIGLFMTKTPLIVIVGSMVFVSALAVRGGVEILGRAAGIFVPLYPLTLLLISLLLLPDMKLKHLFPVLENGIGPSIRGAVVPQAWFSEFFIISFLLPFLSNREKGMKWGIISILSVLVSLVLSNLLAWLTFGPLTSDLIYPTIKAIKYISIADFLEHIESIFTMIWITGAFLKISIFYYILVLGTAQWSKLANYQSLVFPMGILLSVFSVWSAPNLSELTHFVETSLPFYLTSMQTVLPVCLWAVAAIRRHRQQKANELT